jgi:hypothetical protein
VGLIRIVKRSILKSYMTYLQFRILNERQAMMSSAPRDKNDKLKWETDTIHTLLLHLEEEAANGNGPVHPPLAVTQTVQNGAEYLAHIAEHHSPEEFLPCASAILASAVQWGSRLADYGVPYSSLTPCDCEEIDDEEIITLLNSSS